LPLPDAASRVSFPVAKHPATHFACRTHSHRDEDSPVSVLARVCSAQPYSPARILYLPGRQEFVQFPAQTRSPTTVTPRLTTKPARRRSVSSASPCIAPRVSPISGAKVFAGCFSEGVPRLICNRVRRSAKLLNSRNCLIITTRLHIVNRCSRHLKDRVQSSKPAARIRLAGSFFSPCRGEEKQIRTLPRTLQP
jgi:hypothetical protein